MSLKLREKTYQFLKDKPQERFTTRQIAEWIFETYPAECEEKRQNSNATTLLDSDGALIQQLVREIGSSRIPIQKKYPKIKTTVDRPRKYYYSDKSDEEEIATSEPQETQLSEKDLYPILTDYLYGEYHLFSKRINEGKSSNKRGKNGNKWLHPDIVAIEFLNTEWHDNLKKLHQAYGDKRIKIWSFEVKLLINRSNVREVFFQTVSNSSWANLGYLVAQEINQDAIEELNILSNLHGIGVINIGDDGGLVLFPARERAIDWSTTNRIATENKDFKIFIEAIEKLLKQQEEYHAHIFDKAGFYKSTITDDD